MYRHIVWDFDGTLFNTYPAMASAFQSLLKENGIEEDLEDILKHMKISMGHALNHYETRYQLDAHFMDHYREKRIEAEIKLNQPYPGIIAICQYIAHSGRYNYLFTHRGSSSFVYLKQFDLLSSFQDFITEDSGFPRKPAPEGLLYLMDKYDMHPDETLMIGDRELDILAAKNAGAHACFFSEDDATSQYADFTIKDFKELYDIL